MQSQAAVRLDFPFPEERVFRYQAMQDILHHLMNQRYSVTGGYSVGYRATRHLTIQLNS